MRKKTESCQWYEEPLHVQVLTIAMVVLVLVVSIPVMLLGTGKVVEVYRKRFESCGRYDIFE